MKGCIPVYPPDKSIRCQESHRTSQQSIDRARQETIAEEKQTRHKAGYVEFVCIVPDAVGENPEGAAAAGKEALPPPVVVLEMLVKDLRGFWDDKEIPLHIIGCMLR